jgi:hypothetical protein
VATLVIVTVTPETRSPFSSDVVPLKVAVDDCERVDAITSEVLPDTDPIVIARKAILRAVNR